MDGLQIHETDGSIRRIASDTLGRRLRQNRTILPLRERVAIAIFEAPYGEWWGVANRGEKRAARKQADAALALLCYGEGQ